ncbi:AraC family transcriptional regulator [Xylanibacillus composti]|uniref:Transcriptional regulator n=1 Tax=Xylanibacillus composti TaxID=1572762 RepID=A0A8J4H2D0_9BACL|nr:AraC family transcriptional regulator [Xylanibacillus composti]MDT9724893.1 AraC family transcriptional regulator [Xylanibacillus composti]GIQ68127.1 transcriptional regulator [Xylanibacillus composti]
MRSDYGFAISMLYPLKKSLLMQGCDFEHVCRQVGFDADRLHDPEDRIDEEDLIRLMYEAAAHTQDDHFGLHQGALTDVSDLGILGYVMMHSANVKDALQCYRRYHDILCSGYNMDWQVQGNELRLYFLHVHASNISRHCMEDMVSAVFHLLGRMASRPVPVRELHFRHEPPSDVSPYTKIFGIVPRFSAAHNMLLVDKEVLDYPILYADARLRRTFEPMAESMLEQLVQGKVFTDKVVQHMMDCLPAAFPSLPETARAFGLSARSLQARLKEEQTTYQELAAQVRREIAVSYLRKLDYSIAEIAYLLHFSEPSSFSMAFKRWTGLTPGQYRDQLLRQTGAG